jgi:hypothetical protein
MPVNSNQNIQNKEVMSTEQEIYDFLIFDICKDDNVKEHNSIDLYKDNRVIKHISWNVSYEHGYKFVDIFGEKDLGEIFVNLIISDVERDSIINHNF